MNRQNRFTTRQLQLQRQLVARYQARQLDGDYMLSDGNNVSMQMQRVAMETARRKMQMKYNEEAEAAAKKQEERRPKKREAWLARQEAIFRPGHVLGTGRTAEQNMLHGYMEDQHPDEGQHDMNGTEQSRLRHQFNAFAQQRIEQEEEAAQPQRRQEYSRESKVTGQTDVRPGNIRGSDALGSFSNNSLPNQTSDYFLGTGYSATRVNSDTNAFANQSAVTNRGHVLGGGNTAVPPRSGNYERDEEALQKREMLESRRRLQEQYDIQVRQDADTKKQEENVAENFEHKHLK